MDGWMDGWMGGWVAGWMDGCMIQGCETPPPVVWRELKMIEFQYESQYVSHVKEVMMEVRMDVMEVMEAQG